MGHNIQQAPPPPASNKRRLPFTFLNNRDAREMRIGGLHIIDEDDLGDDLLLKELGCCVLCSL